MTGADKREPEHRNRHEEPEEVEILSNSGPVDDMYDLLYRKGEDVADALERVQWAGGVLRRQRARNEHNVLEILLGNVAIAEERLAELRKEAVQLLTIVKIRYNRDRQGHDRGY